MKILGTWVFIFATLYGYQVGSTEGFSEGFNSGQESGLKQGYFEMRHADKITTGPLVLNCKNETVDNLRVIVVPQFFGIKIDKSEYVTVQNCNFRMY